MKPILTIEKLIESARLFCEIESKENHVELIGITDGKAVGTYVEHKFQHFLQSQYLVFVYDKQDTYNSCILHFTHCTFIDKERTADFTITKRLREMIYDGANKEDIIGFLQDKNVPGDEIVYNDLADEILDYLPEQGYLTISNALQWRLQYARVISLDNSVSGVINYEW